MGTNYYRIPSAAEMESRRDKLIEDIKTISLDPASIEKSFREYEDDEDPLVNMSAWDLFTQDVKVHVGKRSSGWKFSWNFHENKFYSNKQELIDFVISGRIVDEYGDEMSPHEFLGMAFSWGQPNGLVFNEEYENKQLKKNPKAYIHGPKYWDREIDGLRVSSSTQFS